MPQPVLPPSSAATADPEPSRAGAREMDEDLVEELATANSARAYWNSARHSERNATTSSAGCSSSFLYSRSSVTRTPPHRRCLPPPHCSAGLGRRYASDLATTAAKSFWSDQMIMP
ncbi:hypothetical protein ZWY2020_028818 [Hordeum vulgare]|nr:hypothetical protein ZWY2020_028818 [Hordeum vulgare]